MPRKIIGLICNIFEDLKIGGRVTKARCGFNFVTHPAYRGIGARLFKQHLRAFEHPTFGFPTGRASFAGGEAGGA